MHSPSCAREGVPDNYAFIGTGNARDASVNPAQNEYRLLHLPRDEDWPLCHVNAPASIIGKHPQG